MRRWLRARPQATPRDLGLGAGLVCAYVALEWISEVHEHQGLPVTAWNPGLGLVFAAMIVRPVTGFIALFLGMVLAEVLVVHSVLEPAAITVLASVSGGGYAVFAWLARVGFRLDPRVERQRDIAGLLAVGCLGAVANAVLLTLVLILFGTMTWADIRYASVPLLIGDMIGVAVVTPLTLRLMSGDPPLVRAPVELRVAAGLAGFGLLIGLLGWLILRGGDPAAFGFGYVLFLPVVGAALWLGLDGACISLLIMQLALVLLLRLYGYDATTFTAFQTVMTVLSATGLLIGAVVSERNAANRAARIARARLAEREAAAVRADRLNLATGMTSALSHELTQPITAARALARAALLRMQAGGSPDLNRLRENLGGVVTQIDLAAEILSRMRAFVGRGVPEREAADVSAIIDDTFALIRPRASRAGVMLHASLDADLPDIHCDRVQVQQALMNLIGNSLDAIESDHQLLPMPKSRRVDLQVAQNGARLEWTVRDDGPGLMPELGARVFEPLTTTKAEGLGLGLAICALIVEAHGGRIWLERSAPGDTEFRFWLPLEPPEGTHGR